MSARILLQFPEGLKTKALAEAARLERAGNEVFVSSSPCYGACDLALDEARALRADKIIHFGHAEFLKLKPNSKIKIEYIEYPMKVNHARALKKALALLANYKRIGLVTTVQHVGQIVEIRRFLEKNGKKVFIGKGTRTKYTGQILGCDFEAAARVEREVDCFIYFGGGVFHSLGMRVHRPVLAVDPFSGGVRWMDEEIKKAEKRRKFGMMRAAEAKTFGILVSTKIGQFAVARAQKIKKILERKGRRALILVSNEINPEALMNFRAFECYVNTACPRIREDYERFDKPVINYEDAVELAGMLSSR